MSRHTITVVRCDGCGRTDVPMSEGRQFSSSNRWIDICEECDAANRYICRHCKRVHDDDHLCEVMKAKLVDYDRPSAGQYGEMIR